MHNRRCHLESPRPHIHPYVHVAARDTQYLRKRARSVPQRAHVRDQLQALAVIIKSAGPTVQIC